jgi:fructokinase
MSLIKAGASLVVVTRGIKGVQAWHGAVELQVPAVDVVDTIGAGDGFQAALLFALCAIGRIKTGPLALTTPDELRRVLSFATICAASTCGRAGADPPRQSDVRAALPRLFAKCARMNVRATEVLCMPKSACGEFPDGNSLLQLQNSLIFEIFSLFIT